LKLGEVSQSEQANIKRVYMQYTEYSEWEQTCSVSMQQHANVWQ